MSDIHNPVLLIGAIRVKLIMICALNRTDMASTIQSALAAHLSKYLVSPDQLEFGEYLFAIKPTNGVSRRHFHQLITALLNTSGGVIVIDLDVPLESKECDMWRNSLKDYLLKFMPQAIYTDCIRIYEHGGFLQMVVLKSEQFITTESYLFTRGPGAETISVRYHQDISQIQCQEVVRGDAIIFPRTGPFTYMGICPYSESNNLEFKYYTCRTIVDLFKRLNENRATKTTLAMANMSGGGEIILGIKEQGSKIMYIGQEVPDKKKFVEMLTEWLQKDSSGSERVWGELTEVPVEGKHWSCDFIPLGPPPYKCQPTCKSCPHMTLRYIVCLRLFQCPGGVFEKRPESFTIADNGEVIDVPFDDWKDKHRQHTGAKITSKSIQAVQVPTALRKAQATPDALKPTVVFKDEMTISFRKHSSQVQLHDIGEKYSTEHMNNIGIFKPACPVHYTPSMDEIEYYVFKKTGKKLPDSIHDDLSSLKGFGIADETLYLCMKQDVKSMAPTSSPTQRNMPLKPANHILDLLVLTNTPKIFLFVICTTFRTELQQLIAYTMVLCRLMKKKILQHTKKTDQIKSLNIVCKIVSLDGTNSLVSADYYHRWFSDTHLGSFADLSSLLARVLSQAETHFRDEIYLAAGLKASIEQSEILLAIQNSRFNIIEGPPGCGKTLLASNVCEKHGREYSAYISACVALNARVGESKKVDVFYAADNSQILSLLQGELRDKTHVVIDDNHNYTYTDEIARDLCETVARRKMKMYIFQDSQYQNYKEVAPQALRQTLCTGMYGSFFIKRLTEIRRNSQVVGSFLTAQVSSGSFSHDGNEFRCVSEVKGDDITIKHVANLRKQGADNGLLHHIKQLLANPLNTRSRRCTIRDIAVLVDDPQLVAAEEDLQNFHKLFQMFWPDSKVHRAAVYPVEGLIIDTLSNFSGLEAKVVVFVMPRSSDDRPEATSTKYRIAVASRGIERVDFLREDNLDEKLAGSMVCDQYPSNATTHLKTPIFKSTKVKEETKSATGAKRERDQEKDQSSSSSSTSSLKPKPDTGESRPKESEGPSSAKMPKLEKTSIGITQSKSSVEPLGDYSVSDNVVALSKLHEEVDTLKKQIQLKDQQSTELKAKNWEAEKEMRNKIQAIQKQHEKALEALQEKNRNLQKLVAVLSKSNKSTSAS